MRICLVAGDICSFSGDAVVNAANNAGLGGGGVDGAIHRAAGPRLLEACKMLPVHPGLTGFGRGLESTTEVRVPNGSAVPTPAFDLPCKWVIHTAGPVWPKDPDATHYDAYFACLAGAQFKMGARETTAGAQAERVLRDCYKMPMLTAVGMGLQSIAYPAISAGVYGCPVEKCAEVALTFCRDYRDWPVEVTFYLFPEINLPIWQEVARNLGVRVE